jgi:hypothetical protein
MGTNGDYKVQVVTPITVQSAPEALVTLFEDSGGDLMHFLECIGCPQEHHEKTVSRIEKSLKTSSDKTLITRWEQAFNDHLKIRLKFERIKAYDALRDIDSAKKPNEVIQRFKAINGDILAGETIIIKQMLTAPKKGEEDETDTEDLAQVLKGA